MIGRSVVILRKEPFDRIAQEGKNDRVVELLPQRQEQVPPEKLPCLPFFPARDVRLVKVRTNAFGTELGFNKLRYRTARRLWNVGKKHRAHVSARPRGRQRAVPECLRTLCRVGVRSETIAQFPIEL